MDSTRFASKLDFHKSWSMKAGELSALKGCHAIVLREASEWFATGRHDTIAMKLREVSQKIELLVNQASSELDEYIKLAHKF